jgi:hypothetical protein
MTSGVQWFIAILVQELRVIETGGNVVWRNFHLIRADDAEAAYQKANQLGEDLRHEYQNSENQTVRSLFRGVAELLPIYEDLADGAEILFESRENLTEEQIWKMIRDKEALGAFQPRDPAGIVPDLP